MTSSDILRLSVCITTRNRRADVIRCINSLILLQNIAFEIIVLDDASDIALVDDQFFRELDPALTSKLTFLRNEQNRGCPAARNQLVQQAKAPYVFCIDDDAELLNVESIESALKVLDADSQVGAIALSQMDETGKLFPGQPAPKAYNCYNPWYIGYASIFRRTLYLKLGGYREIFIAYYEEAELCARMLNQGYYVVYLPNSIVIHHYSPLNRSELPCLRNSYRNKCFAAIYNQPFALMMISIPVNVGLYFLAHARFCRKHKTKTTYGVPWLIHELKQSFQHLWQERQPLKWQKFYKLYRLKTQRPTYL
ncbi:MAG: glycosyltransferase, partial [Leptolyngbya sp. Prado105]|nr:glycosyltransferase [Leptolyngbya sp. Prado105]